MTPDAVGERLQNALWLAGEALLFRHTNPWELDEALIGWGFAMGPCEAQDLIGLDNVLARDVKRAAPILPRMVAEGRMGKAGGVGYYRYPGGGGAVIDPLIEDLIREESWFAKVERVELSGAEMTSQMKSALKHEAVLLLDLGVARDVIEAALQRDVHFPAHKSLL